MPIELSRAAWSGLVGVAVAASVACGQEARPEIPSPKPIPQVKLGPELATVPVARGGAERNQFVADASVLPRDRAPQLDYTSQTGNFRLSEKVTGATSGATGTVLNDSDEGNSGTLTLTGVTGEFQPDEIVTDEQGGSATVRGSLREGVWVLNFAYKPLRIRRVELPGKGTVDVLYLYYRVVNRTGRPRLFVPQFILVTDDGKRFDDTVIPNAVPIVQAREEGKIPLLGAVENTGVIPPSTKEQIDDAVFGVAFWVITPDIAKSDKLTIYVRGLSDGYQTLAAEGNASPTVLYKTLRLDFARPGDEREFNEREIRVLDPPYEWIYY